MLCGPGNYFQKSDVGCLTVRTLTVILLYMNTTQITRRGIEVLIVTDGPTRLEYSQDTDRRIAYVEDGKVVTKTARGAEELASEAHCWGVPARAMGHAVVFWR